MKRYLNNILNSKRRVFKVSGTVIKKPTKTTYVLSTRNGRMQVESAIAYKLGDRVVAYDGVIQGYAGDEPKAITAEV